MTTSLMIYAALEHRIRQSLKEKELSFPDMKKKPSQTPTARWVFLCFTGIHELRMCSSSTMVTDIREQHVIIIKALGELYEEFYS